MISRHVQNMVTALATVAILAGCVTTTELAPTSRASPAPSPSASADTASPAASAPLGCRMDAGTRPITLTVGDRTREAYVHVPDGVSPEHPAALVLAFHGLGGPALATDQKGRLSAKADETGFVVAYPVGAYNEPQPAWDVLSDVEIQFVDVLLDALEASRCIDPRRVFATGFSMGGGMANVVGCRLADRIAAIAPVSGTFGAAWGSEPCLPGRPVPVLAFHGRADGAVLYPGGPLFGEMTDRPTEAVEEWAGGWAKRNGCVGKPDLSHVASDVELRSWKDCDAPVELYTVTDGGHTWPGGVNDSSDGVATHAISATDLLWTFFEAHPLAG